MTILTLTVQGNNDDIYQDDEDDIMIHGDFTAMGDIFSGAGRYWSGFRFTESGITALPGTTINTAQMEVTAELTHSGNFSGHWAAQDVASGAAFSTTYPDVSSRTQTTATVASSQANFGGNWTAGDVKTQTGLASIIQELADDHSGLDVIVMIWDPADTDANPRAPAAFEDASAAVAELEIDYTVAGGLSIPVAMANYRRLRTPV